MEYVDGGELFERILEFGRFNEKDASKIISQILSAVGHLQDRDICHRDLKPENILFASKEDDAPVKLIDFGLSKMINGVEHMTTQVGTPYYVSPEVLDGKY